MMTTVDMERGSAVPLPLAAAPRFNGSPLRLRVVLFEPPGASLHSLEKALVAAGHDCQVVTEEQALLGMLVMGCDLILLDWIGPQHSRKERIRSIRQHAQAVPIVLCTDSQQADDDMVAALEIGADLYIERDGGPVALARIDALARRLYGWGYSLSSCFVVEEFCFNETTCSVQRGGNLIALSPKEFFLARLMFEHLSRPVPRDHMAAVVWGQPLNEVSRSIDTHIASIRKKLNLKPECGYVLRAVYKVGYQLVRKPSAPGR